MSFGPDDLTPEDPSDPFAFRRNYGGVHPFKVGDRVRANGNRATVMTVYWHMGRAQVDLRFDDKADVFYPWRATRVSPVSAVDQLAELV